MGSVKKWRKKKIAKHKHRKMLKLTRWQRKM
ncbi:MAG TPA: AURKAIP1/COX24 domain-containing protein [Anaerolineae bacterium]|nr:AURKAIP1/COX24 domain-containing protein [Anaerolineae bacterium]